jgi:glycosyltransferase involved in cell wall biosynthesis
MKICHMTSVHDSFDTRIFLKECRSLAKSGFEVFLVSNKANYELIDGVKLIPVKRTLKGRFSRILFFTWKILYYSLKTNSKIFHIHDPELLFAGIILKLLGKKVIFDVHENIKEQIKNKKWLPLNFLIYRLYGLFDWISAKLFYLILAEKSYVDIYKNYTSKSVVILNMPDLEFLNRYINLNRDIENEINLFYVGGVSIERGIDIIINAIYLLKNQNINVHFHCIGPIYDKDKIFILNNYNDVKDNITFYGKMKLDEAYKISLKCHIGLSILKPVNNYLYSYSTKIFEYMTIGMPVITSDFELYKNVIEKHHCGYCINPENEHILADSIVSLINNNSLLKEMGQNGQKAANENYSWSTESKKLVEFYKSLM